MPFNMSGMPGMMPFNMSGMPGMMPFNMTGMPGMMPSTCSGMPYDPFTCPKEFPIWILLQSQGIPDLTSFPNIPQGIPDLTSFLNMSQGISDLTSFFNMSSPGMTSWTAPNMSFVMPGNMPANPEGGEAPPGIAEMMTALQQLLGMNGEIPEGFPLVPGFPASPSTPAAPSASPPPGSQPPVVINYFVLTNTTFNILRKEDGS
nr:BUB3-interacting and GLEBS motif-containing protein ZNF207-like [Penaeus vannamei]